MSDIVERLRRAEAWATQAELAATPAICREAAAEIQRLRGLLIAANDAFDDCTGEYPKVLTRKESWREFRQVEP